LVPGKAGAAREQKALGAVDARGMAGRGERGTEKQQMNIIENLNAARREFVAEFERKLELLDRTIASLGDGTVLESRPAARGGGRMPIGKKINGAEVKRRAKASAVASRPGDPETVVEAARIVCSALGKGAKFLSREIQAKILAKWPGLEERVRKGMCVNLKFMVKKGELKVDGSGKGASYTVVAIRPPSGANVTDREQKWKELRREIQPDIDAKTYKPAGES
jgi:hypothetical protein